MPDPTTDNELKPLNREVEAFSIANFDAISEKLSGYRDRATMHGGEFKVGSRAGDVRVDERVFTTRSRSIAGVGLYSEFNKASLINDAKANVVERELPPQEYSASVYFKKGFVHEVDADRADGGATLSAGLGQGFDAPEDGQGFEQADIDKMVKMAMETDGFEIALDFNADQDGGDVVYDAAYLDANGGHVRQALEAELGGTGIEYEGRSANDVLADYRGHVVENAVEQSAYKQYAATLSGVELDDAVERFMEQKFDKNADRVSYGDEHATLEGHDQGERAVNLMFREAEHDHDHEHDHGHNTPQLSNHKHNSGNHTHMVWGVDKSDEAARLGIHKEHGKEADEGSVVYVNARENNTGRMDKLSSLTDDQAREQAFRVQFKGDVDNRMIDNHKVVFGVDGEVTSTYNEELDCIDVRVDGHLYSVVEWPDAKELIDPARIKIGQVDEHGVGTISVADNIDPALSQERRELAGITPMTDVIEEAVRITTDCKNLYLLSDMDKGAYQEALQNAGMEDRLQNLGEHFKAHTGLDMDNYLASLRAQYINVESDDRNVLAIRDDDQVATEMALTYPELGIDVYEAGSVVDSVSQIYKEPSANEAQLADIVVDDQKMYAENADNIPKP